MQLSSGPCCPELGVLEENHRATEVEVEDKKRGTVQSQRTRMSPTPSHNVTTRMKRVPSRGFAFCTAAHHRVALAQASVLFRSQVVVFRQTILASFLQERREFSRRDTKYLKDASSSTRTSPRFHCVTEPSISGKRSWVHIRRVNSPKSSPSRLFPLVTVVKSPWELLLSLTDYVLTDEDAYNHLFMMQTETFYLTSLINSIGLTHTGK